jgi:hypothetical protein
MASCIHFVYCRQIRSNIYETNDSNNDEEFTKASQLRQMISAFRTVRNRPQPIHTNQNYNLPTSADSICYISLQ